MGYLYGVLSYEVTGIINDNEQYVEAYTMVLADHEYYIEQQALLGYTVQGSLLSPSNYKADRIRASILFHSVLTVVVCGLIIYGTGLLTPNSKAFFLHQN